MIDLGCGDGRVVANMASICGCTAFGVDIRPECIEASIARVASMPEAVRGRCSFAVGDFTTMQAGPGSPPPPAGLGGVTVAFAYLLPEPMKVLDPLLRTAVLEQGLRLVTFVSHPHDIGDWQRDPRIDNRKDLLGALQLWERRFPASD